MTLLNMRFLRRLEGSKEFWFIIITSFLFFILRFPSLFEPLWYGDEGIYQVIGSSLNNGKLLYKEIFDNKPPFLYWLYSFFNSDQFTIRLTSLIFGALAIVVFFLLSKKLFANAKNKSSTFLSRDNTTSHEVFEKVLDKIHFVTTFVFAVFLGLPILEGNIANAENFMLLPILIASFFIVSQKRFFIAGLLLGIAFLFKIVAIFDFSAFFVFCFIINPASFFRGAFRPHGKTNDFPHRVNHGILKRCWINFNSLKKAVKLPTILIGFSLPILAVTLFFLLNDTFTDFIKATFITNISYVSYGNRIYSSPFLILVKLILLGAFTLYVFTKRKNFNTTSLFVLLWVAYSLFNASFSQRPYTHYLLVLLPSLSLMLGLILFDKKHRKIIAILFLVVLIIVVKNFNISNYKKNILYYQNFISYIAGKKSTLSYQTFFDRNTPVDYEIARFIKPKLSKNDTIFIWGNNAQLYQLLGVIPSTKYIVAYHISNYKDGIESTKDAIEKTKPKFIVVMPNRKTVPFPLINYSKKININKAEIYERIF